MCFVRLQVYLSKSIAEKAIYQIIALAWRGRGSQKAIPSEIKWSRPIGRILYSSLRCLDSHSSRRRITPTLKLPTRMLSEQRQRMPIWNCSEWRLPRFTLYSLRCKDSSLWPYSSSHDGRSLTVTLLCGVRTFLSLSPLRDCQRLSSLLHTGILAEIATNIMKGFK